MRRTGRRDWRGAMGTFIIPADEAGALGYEAAVVHWRMLR